MMLVREKSEVAHCVEVEADKSLATVSDRRTQKKAKKEEVGAMCFAFESIRTNTFICMNLWPKVISSLLPV